MKAYGIGRIANDLTTSKTQTGKTKLDFTLACDKRNKKQLEAQGKPTADFVRCVAWEKTAELIAQYAQKGSELFVEGDVITRSYQDTTGRTVYITEILIDEMRFLGKAVSKAEQPREEETIDLSADYLPF